MHVTKKQGRPASPHAQVPMVPSDGDPSNGVHT